MTALAVCALLSRAEAQCTYEVTAVIRGPFCPQFGFSTTAADAINDAGEVAGDYVTCLFGPGEAFVWTAQQGMTVLERPIGSLGAGVTDISENGVVVGAVVLPPHGRQTATMWIDGEPIDLGWPPGGNNSLAVAVNSKADIAGKWLNDLTGPLQGFLWRDGAMINLAPDLGTVNGEALGLSEAGLVVGWMGTSMLVDSHAFIWEKERVVDLGVIPEGYNARALAINDRGDVVGAGQIPAEGEPFGRSRAFHWNGTQMFNLGTLPPFSLSAALDINNSSIIVGNLWSGGEAAFIVLNGDLVNLNDLIPSPPAGLTVIRAKSINELGQIAGDGRYEGDPSPFGVVLTPVPTAPGDLTCDGIVGHEDVFLLLDHWGPATIGSPADLDDDNEVGIVDLLMLLANWG